MAIQSDETLVTKGDLKELYQDKILPYLGGNVMMTTNVSDYYSEDEKVVGIWTNGKPIYQKTFTYLSATVNSTPQFYTVANISSYNIDKIINCFGNMQWGVDGPYYSLPFTLSTNYIISVDAYLDSSEPNLILRTYRTNGTTTISDITITLQYTKTTDVANSALTTPGCYDLNRPDLWPENKEIFFGNGLYGQRFTGTLTSAASTRMLTHIYNYPIYLVSYGGYVTYNPGGDTMMLGYHQDDTNYVCALYAHASDGLYLFTKSAAARTNAPYDVWVTYTK